MLRRILSLIRFVGLPVLVIALVAVPVLLSAQTQSAEKAQQEKEQEKPVRITEEIRVVGKAPRLIPLATVTTIDSTAIQQLRPLDLSEVLKFAPGTMITVGAKDEYTLKLRGIDSGRIALLVDGVPIVEPYFGTFDLKTVSSGGIESMQITKGPSSVLYGPNTLGGIVNVITRRPGPDPSAFLTLSLGNQNTRTGGTDAAFQLGRFGVVASADYQDSNGFRYKDPVAGEQTRALSDYSRFNLSGKVIYNPSSNSEFMLDAGTFHTTYGIPPALVGSARYWRFKDWDRTSVSGGGYTVLGDWAVLRLRGYYVNYDNVLDQYTNSALTAISAESTYNNPIYGLFGIGEFTLARWNTLKASIYYEGDRTKLQDNSGLPWTTYKQNMTSVGVEDHVSFLADWHFIAGVSLDTLAKYVGGSTTKVNPLVGIKYSPGDALDIHVSFATKSKFPSMRELYSSSNGNPDLRSEFGRSFEVSATYNKGVFLSGSVFFNALRDFINSLRLPDGTRRFVNINRARINGAEFQAQEAWRLGAVRVDALLNYTFLDHRDETNGRPLDILPKHNFNFEAGIRAYGVRAGLSGLLASKSWLFNTSTSSETVIPSFFSLDAVVSCSLRNFEPFIRLTNIFNHFYYTEPGFPWRGRYLEVGLKTGLF